MLIDVAAYELKAKKLLDKGSFEFIAGGSGNESTLQKNKSAYEKYNILPRALQNTPDVDLSIKLLDLNLSIPILMAPMAAHGLANKKEKEIGSAKAAKNANTIMITSTMASTSLEDIATSVQSPLWFQLYLFQDRKITESLIHRAEKAGYKALVITVDLPQRVPRKRDIINKFTLPKDCGPINLKNEGAFDNNSKYLDVDFANTILDKQFTWKDIDWIKQITKLPIILKGIINPLDVKLALEYKVDGIIVSNHGGRQLDGTIATIDILSEIASVINKKIPILIDGGIRTGQQILIALALGADAVLLGRPMLWGLAVNGSKGAYNVLNILKNELALTMALCGCKNIAEIKRNAKTLIRSSSD